MEIFGTAILNVLFDTKFIHVICFIYNVLLQINLKLMTSLQRDLQMS